MRVLLLALFVAAVSCQHHPNNHGDHNNHHGHTETQVKCTSQSDCDSVTCQTNQVKECLGLDHDTLLEHEHHCVCHHSHKRAVGSNCTSQDQCHAHGQGHCAIHGEHLHCDDITDTCQCSTSGHNTGGLHGHECNTVADCTKACEHQGTAKECNKAHTNEHHTLGHCVCNHH